MPNTGRAEIYFIVAMMILILIISAVAVFFFVKTYKKEMKAREDRENKKIENRKSKIEN